MGSPGPAWLWQAIVIAVHICCLAAQQRADSSFYGKREYTHLSSPEECSRQCRENEKPKTCYFHWTLEEYPTLGAACVSPNTSAQCIQADGVERTIFCANRMLPGPSIQVCEGDTVVVDVFNKIPGEEVTIHWHGIHQRKTQYYDGVPFVTQCPIPQGTTFRYRWYANPGTHFWHSHSGLQKLDGLHGSLIVRQTRSRDVSSSLYDIDSPKHVIEISDWLHEAASARFPGRYTNQDGPINQNPDTLLINGLGKYTHPVTGVTTNTSYADFTMKSGKRYRFRVITSTALVCLLQLSFENHSLLAIATDGEPFRPVKVDTIVMSSGERYDFVVTANQIPGSYWIQVRALGECAEGRVQQLAVLRYENMSKTPSTPPPTYDDGLPQGVILNPLQATCDGSDPNRICVSELVNAHPVDPDILQERADFIIFLPFRFHLYPQEELFRRGSYDVFLVNDQFLVKSLITEISYTSPSSPLLSQRDNIPPDQFCNDNNMPARCQNTSKPCTCTHMYHMPYNSIVEVILMDIVSVADLSHPFHLHGYSFNVVGMGTFPSPNVTMQDMQAVLDSNRTALFERQSYRPPAKDTLVVPNNGYTIIRFRADNPGYWFYHCHFLYHILIGMNFVVHVGRDRQLPPVPPNFPRCGNFLPPIKPIYSEY